MPAAVSPDRISDPSKLPSLPPLREVIARHGLAARRSLGQHFLLDLNLTRRIAGAAGPLNDATVIEIGPGPGGLTRALLETGAARIVAVERDPRCIAALQELQDACPGVLEVIEADALAFRPASVLGAGEKCVIVANLPYNLATPLLIGWLRDLSAIRCMTLMFQKEVAERITSRPGAASYGRLSVVSQWLCEARLLFDIPPRAFVPPPKVTSTLVQLVPKAEGVVPVAFETIEALTRAAFGQRRKMLRSSLKGLTGDPEKLLAAAGIRPDRRAETLTVADFCALARAQEHCTRTGGSQSLSGKF
jgi:16S rRNA (adenine1518-N6/adenine1519-N6)-dimethyltransferase